MTAPDDVASAAFDEADDAKDDGGIKPTILPTLENVTSGGKAARAAFIALLVWIVLLMPANILSPFSLSEFDRCESVVQILGEVVEIDPEITNREEERHVSGA